MKKVDQKFEEVYQENLDRVYRYIHSIVHNGTIAEDITAEVFLKVWEKRTTLLDYENVTGLLYKISKDLSINYLKTLTKNQKKKEEFFNLYFNPELEGEEDLLREIQLAALTQAIDLLPEKCQKVVKMKFINGKSLKEISTELQISVNTVQNHLTKGKNLIKDLMSTDEALLVLLVAQLTLL